ncbi:MAG TPA: COX15/CtaA family protein [Phycisphaerae bacterium]|nr:COX15/CtaA family protein [Phycisphaerae bacterium]
MNPSNLDYATRSLPRPANRWLHRFAILVAVATFVLIIAGGLVTSTGSGLSVPDWPTTYGHNMFTFPWSQWVGGIRFEHSHRLIASTVGFLTIVLCIWLWRREPRRWLCWLGTAALLAVITQGVLGGLTVLYLLPTPISVLHGCLAQMFLCMVVSIAVFTSPRWTAQPKLEPAINAGAPQKWALLLTLGIFGQLILGAVMRHTESGLAVPDFPRAYGQWAPDLGESAIDRYNEQRRFEMLLPVVTREQIVYHLAHRAGAIAVAILVLAVAGRMLRDHGRLASLRRPAVLLMVLLAVQIALGAWTVWSEKSALIATAHVAIGAAMLATAWVLTLRCYRDVAPIRQEQLEFDLARSAV